MWNASMYDRVWRANIFTVADQRTTSKDDERYRIVGRTTTGSVKLVWCERGFIVWPPRPVALCRASDGWRRVTDDVATAADSDWWWRPVFLLHRQLNTRVWYLSFFAIVIYCNYMHVYLRINHHSVIFSSLVRKVMLSKVKGCNKPRRYRNSRDIIIGMGWHSIVVIDCRFWTISGSGLSKTRYDSQC